MDSAYIPLLFRWYQFMQTVVELVFLIYDTIVIVITSLK